MFIKSKIKFPNLPNFPSINDIKKKSRDIINENKKLRTTQHNNYSYMQPYQDHNSRIEYNTIAKLPTDEDF